MFQKRSILENICIFKKVFMLHGARRPNSFFEFFQISPLPFYAKNVTKECKTAILKNNFLSQMIFRYSLIIVCEEQSPILKDSFEMN